MELAAQVEEGRILGSILALQDLGTRYTFSNGDEAAADYLVAELEELGFEVERDPFDVTGTTAENLIARLPGTIEPEVVYIFSAHYDSTSPNPMTTAPGADDNATGVAAVLEAARILAPHSFRHSLWFVLTAAEEQGSLGSEHMVGWLGAQGIDVRGVIAPDMIGYWPLGDDDAFDILGDTESTALVDQMAGWATQLGVAHKRWIMHDYCYGDDHTNFQEAGFPAITPMDCVEAHNIPSSGESTPHYHLTTDRSETLHLPFTARVVGVIVAALADLGDPVAAP
jgi:Zn-dependent M28 family amino/carboxypeptidase